MQYTGNIDDKNISVLWAMITRKKVKNGFHATLSQRSGLREHLPYIPYITDFFITAWGTI
jgi:hypothetical protein